VEKPTVAHLDLKLAQSMPIGGAEAFGDTTLGAQSEYGRDGLMINDAGAAPHEAASETLVTIKRDLARRSASRFPRAQTMRLVPDTG